ncbi:MAG: transcriptional regulator [Clostridia bacterium]|nr:transcriptional regulator [Clostridia bacterium]
MEERFKTFTVLIAGINRCIRRIKTEEMAELGLKSPHVSCLYYLYKTDSLTATELCDICEEDKANISRSIRHLEENGYIVCNAKTAKRYQSPLELTEKGREVGKIVAGKIDRILEEASEGLSEADRITLYRSLTLIHDNLRKICSDYGESK